MILKEITAFYVTLIFKRQIDIIKQLNLKSFEVRNRNS